MHKRSGVTLVELAIVLVIAGLLAGGVLQGIALKERYVLRKAIDESNAYVISLHQFKDKYSSLPGDLPTATAVWGRADGGMPADGDCTSNATSPSTGKPTCNGNGNGYIEVAQCESFLAWHQLAVGEFIIGVYNGVADGVTCGTDATPNVNVPRGPIENSGFSINSMGEILGGTDPILFDGNYANSIIFGLQSPGNLTTGGALTPRQAEEIDSKVDDGSPAAGHVRGFKPGGGPNPACVAGTGYNTELDQKACATIFLGSYLDHSTNH